MKNKITICTFFMVLMLVVTTIGCAGKVNNEKKTDADKSQITESQTDGNLSAETSSSTEKMTQTEKPTEPVTKKVTITMTGDCSLGKLSVHGYEGTFYEMYDLYGASYFFKNVKSIFESDDMTLVNFEGVLTKSTSAVDKQFNIKGEPEYINILTQGDVEAVSFANNHVVDYGQQGHDDTVDAFKKAGVVYAFDDQVGVFTTKDGVKVGIVAANEVHSDAVLASAPATVEGYLKNGIEKLKGLSVDVIVACCHWGDESVNMPTEYQKVLGKKCIDWGADIVVGNHAHVLQGIDYYKGKYILYGLGNFCFGGNRNPAGKDTAIAQVTFSITDKKCDEGQLKLIPCTISSVMTRNDYCPTLATGDMKTMIINNMNAFSNGFGVSISQEGIVSHK